jgi:hypothetical protein
VYEYASDVMTDCRCAEVMKRRGWAWASREGVWVRLAALVAGQVTIPTRSFFFLVIRRVSFLFFFLFFLPFSPFHFVLLSLG